MNMNAGDKVKTKQPIDGFFKQSLPAGAPGIVLRTTMLGRADVVFTLPGLAGGSRTVEVSVDPRELVKI
ncbi:hypothetical protein [Embleya sp. AB8]|uniref:hypothetical protein n=1 Tax=Embleya sp. AB8 TaxID=3156304 RepID=UPI003C7503D1